MSFTLETIAIAHTPFKEKFAIPRQPSLAPAAKAVIELQAPFNKSEALAGLDGVSHVWLLFYFHQVPSDKAAASLRVRPPRLGGNQKIGVFASRSTHRPNGIGQSVVRLEKVEGTRLYVSGVDLLDQTPILDIKPYVPYVDSIPDAHNEMAGLAPDRITVSWSPEAEQQAAQAEMRLNEEVRALIEQCLAQDPKPAYQASEPSREYGVVFWDLNVCWHYPEPNRINVLRVERVKDEN